MTKTFLLTGETFSADKKNIFTCTQYQSCMLEMFYMRQFLWSRGFDANTCMWQNRPKFPSLSISSWIHEIGQNFLWEKHKAPTRHVNNWNFILNLKNLHLQLLETLLVRRSCYKILIQCGPVETSWFVYETCWNHLTFTFTTLIRKGSSHYTDMGSASVSKVTTKILIISPGAYICSNNHFVIFSWDFVWNFRWGGLFSGGRGPIIRILWYNTCKTI